MREYELMFIVAQRDVKEGLHDTAIESIRGEVDKLGGRVLRVRPWGLRQLAYEIQGHDYGYYVILQILLEPDQVSALEGKLRDVENVIRFLVTYQGERGEAGEELEDEALVAVNEEEIAAAAKTGQADEEVSTEADEEEDESEDEKSE